MKIINNKKGAALLWCILLTVILTILLGSITAACYAYFNYTLYTVKRQQAYFTARSAINVVLDNLSSVEQTKESASSETSTSKSYTINYDGNYIINKNVVDKKGNILYYATDVGHDTFCSTYVDEKEKVHLDADGYVIEDYTMYEWSWKEFKTISTNYIVRTHLARRAVSTAGTSYTSSSSEIDLLPSANSTVTVTDFGFGENMGIASATIYRDEDDTITVKVTSHYPDADGEEYELEATVVRQPVYFGGIAVRKLNLSNGNLSLSEGTDFYWNNTDEFNTSGNTAGSFKNGGNYHLDIRGNLVTKGNATITKGNIVANKIFNGTAYFTNDPLKQKKIWNPSQYIISNKSLLVGDTGTEYSISTLATISSFFKGNVHPEYCNSRGSKNAFGGILSEGVSKAELKSLLDIIDLGEAYNGFQDEKYALKNTGTDQMAIQYIEILSLSNSVNQRFNEYMKNPITAGAASTLKTVYNKIFGSFFYDFLDVSYIDYASYDENNRSDEVIPLTYLKIPSGITVRVRYGCDPGNRTGLGKSVQQFKNNVEALISAAFDTNSNAAYNVVYMEDNSTIEIGWNKDGMRNINGNQAANLFYYSIYGNTGTKVILYDDVIVVGEIVCESLEIKGNAQVIYSSTNGAQVAKQKVAEYWSVSNYSD